MTLRLACVSLPEKGATDLLLQSVAAELMSQGVRVAGTVQANTGRVNRRKCDMDLQVLPDGPLIRISEDRGSLARGCILDSDALEQAVAQVAMRLPGADVLILNKFGKREAEGRGLVPIIADALQMGLPVLVGVSSLNLSALMAFSDGQVLPLQGEIAALLDWCKASANA